jgi:MFS family permease
VALVGAALWGAGAALCFPIAVAAVSDDHRGAQARVSVITSMGSIAVLTAAPLVGVAAEALGGAQQALLVVLVPLAAALFAARWVAPSLTRVADPAEILADVPETVPAS